MYEKALKFVKSIIYLLVGFVILGILYAAVIYPYYIKSQATIGMDKETVLANLKDKKYLISSELTLCKNDAWYGDCESANKSDSSEFLILKIGIDTWFVVGFNKLSKVSFVGLGDT